MNFVNTSLAFGAFAFTIPLIIHLLHRNRFRTVEWGAMHLIEPVVRSNRRRMQWMNWILLLIRIAIPILLAFCLARPVLTQFSASQQGQPRHHVLIVDNSVSMSVAGAKTGSSISRAKKLLRDYLSNLDRRDKVIVLPTSRLDQIAGIGGRREALKSIDELEPVGGPVSVDRMIRAGLRSIRASTGDETSSVENTITGATLVVVSDFSNVVAKADPSELTALGESLNQDSPYNVVLVDVSDRETGRKHDNLAISDVVMDQPAATLGAPVSIKATVVNYGDQTVEEALVKFRVGSKDVGERKITLSPKSSVTLRVETVFENTGTQVVRVRLDREDQLNADNQKQFAIDVKPQVKVALHTDVQGGPVLEQAGGFLTLALSPMAMAGDQQVDSIVVENCNEGKLQQKLNQFSGNRNRQNKDLIDCVVIAGKKKMSPALAKRLDQFVQDGGNLLFFDGPNVDAASYNRTAGLLTPLADITPIKNRSTSTLLADNFAPWSFLGDDRGGIELELSSYRGLKQTLIASQSESDSNTAKNSNGAGNSNISSQESDAGLESKPTQVIWRTDGTPSLPLAWRTQRGKGMVVQFAIPATTEWSEWPLDQNFLPMIQQLVLSLCGQSEDLNVTVGSTISIPIPKNDDGTLSTFRVYDPRGQEIALETSEQSELKFTAGAVGNYRVEFQSDKTDPPNSQIRIAMLPDSESDFAPISTDRLDSLAESLKATQTSDAVELSQIDSIARYGREIWQYLLAALLFFMVGELFWQQFAFSRQPIKAT